MDINVHVYYHREKFASYEARIDKRAIPEDMPAKYINLAELSAYLAKRENHDFDIDRRELSITFRTGRVSYEV